MPDSGYLVWVVVAVCSILVGVEKNGEKMGKMDAHETDR